jgi:transcriptional regulator with XRE-family HTH domain
VNIDYILLGQRISQIRKSRGMTQDNLAEKSDISNNFISHIENSHSIPSLETLLKICAALEVTPNDVLIGASTETKEYLNNEIVSKIENCNPKEKRLINGFINLLIKERQQPD